MGGEFWLGFVMGVVVVFGFALLAPIDTVSTVAERGFFTLDDKLYVVELATPRPNVDEGDGK